MLMHPKDAILTEAPNDHSQIDDFQDEKLDINWNTLRVPFFQVRWGRVGKRTN